MADPLDALRAAGIRAYEYGVTAIDRYLGRPAAPLRFIAVEAGMVDLAKAYEKLEYPGLPYADASLPDPGDPAGAGSQEIRFLCVESLSRPGLGAHPDLGASPAADFTRDPLRGFFRDPADIRHMLRAGTWPAPDPAVPGALFETAVLYARVGACDPAIDPGSFPLPASISAQYEKDLLSLMVTAPHPARGFDFLLATGFIARFWPEISGLEGVDHAKDHHPEGGGWAHTMETFTHRKTPDAILSLALLLHDTGKARSGAEAGRKFHRHAEIGATMARRFLSRLGFAPGTVRDVEYLIRSHMLPAALPRLPMARVGEVVADSRFPMLLELYRCDEFSSFKGPEAYYEACAAYKAYLKNAKNPFRDSDGRKYTRNGAA